MKVFVYLMCLYTLLLAGAGAISTNTHPPYSATKCARYVTSPQGQHKPSFDNLALPQQQEELFVEEEDENDEETKNALSRKGKELANSHFFPSLASIITHHYYRTNDRLSFSGYTSYTFIKQRALRI